MTAEELAEMDYEQLRDAVIADLRVMYWQKVWDMQDDLLFNGTNGASDEALTFFGLNRTNVEH